MLCTIYTRHIYKKKIWGTSYRGGTNAEVVEYLERVRGTRTTRKRETLARNWNFLFTKNTRGRRTTHQCDTNRCSRESANYERASPYATAMLVCHSPMLAHLMFPFERSRLPRPSVSWITVTRENSGVHSHVMCMYDYVPCVTIPARFKSLECAEL